MTAARRPRSAALLVGSTSGTAANVQSAGQSFSRFLASACTWRCRFPVEPVGCANSVEPGNPCFAAGSILETRCGRWDFDIGEADVILARASSEFNGLGLVV